MAFESAGVPRISARPFLITFSGIDGAGKTTQIELLKAHLEERGLRVLRLSFWEDVAVWSSMRAGIGYRAVTAAPSPATALSFSPRNHKHVRTWYLTAARSGFYFLDIGRLHRLLARLKPHQYDVLIFDRYIYDQIANIYAQSFVARAYGRLLLGLTPSPDLAFIVDAQPAQAFARKPEYPLEFVYRNRRSFLQLREIHPSLIFLSPAGVEEVALEIRNHVCRSLQAASFEAATSHTGNTEPPRTAAVIPQQTLRTVQEEPTANI